MNRDDSEVEYLRTALLSEALVEYRKRVIEESELSRSILIKSSYSLTCNLSSRFTSSNKKTSLTKTLTRTIICERIHIEIAANQGYGDSRAQVQYESRDTFCLERVSCPSYASLRSPDVLRNLLG